MHYYTIKIWEIIHIMTQQISNLELLWDDMCSLWRTHESNLKISCIISHNKYEIHLHKLLIITPLPPGTQPGGFYFPAIDWHALFVACGTQILSVFEGTRLRVIVPIWSPKIRNLYAGVFPDDLRSKLVDTVKGRTFYAILVKRLEPFVTAGVLGNNGPFFFTRGCVCCNL